MRENNGNIRGCTLVKKTFTVYAGPRAHRYPHAAQRTLKLKTRDDGSLRTFLRHSPASYFRASPSL